MKAEQQQTIEELGTAWVSLAKNQAKVFALESELAHLSLFPLLISVLAMTLLSLSLWLSVLAMVGYGIYVWSHFLWIGLGSLVLVNALAFFLARFAYKRYLKRMRFEHTRESLRELLG